MHEKIIAIGGLGGSGTRLVADILLKSGVFLGDDLNVSNDNLIFTRLFKNPVWYAKAGIGEKRDRIRIFERYMRHGRLSIKDWLALCLASKNNPTFASQSSFYLRTLQLLFRPSKSRDVWGWKEPNTHILIKEILDYYPGLKYVHVLRNGLDMVFSDNQQQLQNWGWIFGIYPSEQDNYEETIERRLDYWIQSTNRILALQKQYPEGVYLLNFSTLCSQPAIQVKQLLAFCDIAVPEEELIALVSLPKDNGSSNRFKNFDLSFLAEDKIRFVQQMGFDLDIR